MGKIGLNVITLLTDDLKVRESAKKLNITPVGSLGIITMAYKLGQISIESAEDHIHNLYEVSSLFVTKTIVEMAIEQLHKYSADHK